MTKNNFSAMREIILEMLTQIFGFKPKYSSNWNAKDSWVIIFEHNYMYIRISPDWPLNSKSGFTIYLDSKFANSTESTLSNFTGSDPSNPKFPLSEIKKFLYFNIPGKMKDSVKRLKNNIKNKEDEIRMTKQKIRLLEKGLEKINHQA